MEVVGLEVGVDVDGTLTLSFDQDDSSNPLQQFSDSSLPENDRNSNWISSNNHDNRMTIVLSLTKAQPCQRTVIEVPAAESKL